MNAKLSISILHDVVDFGATDLTKHLHCTEK